MRDYVLLYINGKEHRIKGSDVFMPISDYLRYHIQNTGTKVVCAEGDCGACSVFVGRVNASGSDLNYVPVNSCIQFVYQLDRSHIVSVEGLKVEGELNKVQESMVDCHGAQCGYCTPGFIVAMCSMFECDKKLDQQSVKDGLTGNLCRCTGYESIIKAAMKVDPSEFKRLAELYPPAEILAAFKKLENEPVEIDSDGVKFCGPTSLGQAVEFKAKNPGTIVVSGGTDVCVNVNKRGYEPKSLVSMANVPGLDELRVENGWMIVGARVTLSQLESFVKEHIPELHRILWLFGSPQIRNAATLAGNIANGSPIADSIPFLYIMEAEVDVDGEKGPRRISIDKLYTGYKTLSLKPDEIISRIQFPLPVSREMVKLYKVSRREHLDISSFTAAIRMQRDVDVISSASIAFGGVGPLVLRLPKTEEFLITRKFNLDTFREAGRIAREEITPISDVRGSKDFRLQLAENIFSKFYYEMAQEKDLVCLK